jgi:hypothetical protein
VNTSSALCRGRLDLFFDEDPASVAFAKSICSECPLAGLCLAGAMERQELYGVWGGTDYYERCVIDPDYPPRDDIEHGTPAGYYQHQRFGMPIEAACGCIEAHRESAKARMRLYRQRKKNGYGAEG